MWRLVWLGMLFFLSGASALAYQVVWQRQLSTVFGVTVYATAAVLAAFMAGLALGSALGGRAADRVRRPLLLFAAAEAGVALLALSAPWALGAADRVYPALVARWGLGFSGLTAARMLCSFLLLLPPTALMGVTLPALIAATKPSGELRSRIAWLYGLNTLGAFAGALAAGYVLIGAIGLGGTVRLAAAVNLVVALGAVVLGRSDRAAPARASGADEPAPALSRAQARVLLAAFGVSGFVALGLEVVWFRMLIAYLPTTTYAFTTMLATVLAGIGIGGVLAARRRTRAEGELSRLGTWMSATGALSVLTAGILAWTYAAGWRTSGLVQACVVALLPATTLMGMTYARGLALWAGASEGVGARAGAFAAVNLGGAILGSLGAGFALVPAAGTRVSLVALSALSVVAGLALWQADDTPRKRTVVAGVLLVFLAGAAWLPDPFSTVLRRRHKGESVLWREEGAQGTVAVHRGPGGENVLYIDGMHQANDSADMRALHQRIGLLPLMLHPGPRRALAIGLAGGATPGALALDPEVQVDVVELSAPVVRASAFFRHINGSVLRRPNVRLLVDDGRNYLSLTSERYDIITADLIQPFHAGAGHLYSVEYFRLCRRALTDRGLMVQWIGHPAETQYKLILRTFLEVFPHATLWAQSFLVGSPASPRLSEERMGRLRRHAEAAAASTAAGLDSVDALLALYSASSGELRRFAGPGDVLSDDHPRTEYYRSLGPSAGPVDLSGLARPDARDLLRP